MTEQQILAEIKANTLTYNEIGRREDKNPARTVVDLSVSIQKGVELEIRTLTYYIVNGQAFYMSGHSTALAKYVTI